MPESKHSTSIDWAAVDRLEPTPDPDSPELTQADFARGEWRHGGKPSITSVSPAPIEGTDLVSIPIDRAVLARFRQSGPDWQKRINDVLRKAVGL